MRIKNQPYPSSHRPPLSLEVRGLLDMVGASLFFAAMGACVFGVSLIAPSVDAPAISLIRVAVNLITLLIPALIKNQLVELFGDARPSLWLRGLFGGTSLILSFASIHRIGPGESSFLTSSSGIFVAALSPWVLQQRNRWLDWMSILVAFGGLYLLMAPGSFLPDLEGRMMGLMAGVLAALAYLMVSRSGRTNSPSTIVFYFAFIGLFLHLFWFMIAGITWPNNVTGWSLTLCAGLLGSIAQIFLTRAYQSAPAARVSAIGFLTPVLSLALSIFWFGKYPEPRALVGCSLVLLAGVLLPLLRARAITQQPFNS